jgi:gliding motility-associated-like protein
MKTKHILFTLLIISNLSNPAIAKELDYIKNLGQWDSKINYKVNLQGGNLFLENTTFTYLFYDIASLEHLHKHDEHIHAHENLIDAYSFKVELLNANEEASKIGNHENHEYHNYFIGNNSAKWKGKVPLFDEVNYSSIYKGIDLKLYSQDYNLKYDFIVSPGANTNQIQLHYNHVNNSKLINGELHIDIGFNTIIEQKPYAFQTINGKTIDVECNYIYNNNILSFEFPNGYDSEYELIIDPVLIASTLSGSTITNYGHSATFDNEGNIYTGARNFGIGYPATTGAFQMNFGGGGTDIAISKLNPDGSNLIWATYIGGNNAEYPHSMFVSNTNELYVYGSTNSANYPTTENAFITTSTSSDIIVTHLSLDGSSLIGSTFVGGSGSDGTNIASTNYGDSFRGEIIVDGNGNAYVSSFSSSDDFPTTTNAYQTSYNGGQDGVVFKMTPDLSAMTWATYIGTSGDESAYGLRLDSEYNVYVTGSTNSIDFPTTTNAANPNYIGGEIDAFILKFKHDGTTLLASSFFGSDGKDQSFFLDIDNSGDVYIYGQNSETINITPSCYGVANSSQFIAKLNADLDTVLWQTTVGTGSISISIWDNYDLVPVAFMVDVCKHIYISGYSANPGLFVSPNPIQASGGFYEMVLEADATAINYATYYTGDHVDGGTSRFDPAGKIYQAVCSGGGFNTTANAYATTQSAGWDMAVFKIDLNTSIVAAQASVLPSTTGCAPFDVSFNNISTPGMYNWNFDDGTTSTQTSPTHTFETPGTYEVELIVTDPESCNFSDTLNIPIYVSSSTGNYSFDIDNACLGTPIQFTAIGATSQDTILWNLGDGTFETTLNPIHNYSTTGTYNINLTINSLCNFTAEFSDQIIVDVEPDLELGEDFFICQDETAIITATSDATNFLWQDNSTNNFITISEAGTFSVVASNGDCTVIDQLAVTQDPFSFEIGNDTTLCNDSPILTLDAGLDAASYLWSTGDTTQTITVSEGGYSVDVISELNCEYDDQIDILVQVFDVNIEASSQEECEPATIEFNDLSTINTGTIYNWEWDFEVESSSNPTTSVYYENANIYDVTLTIQSVEGCEETYTFENYIQINPNPIASFSYTYSIENDCNVSIEFMNNSIGDNLYQWDFSNGEESILNDPQAMFETNRVYEIVLEAENSFGCMDITRQQLEIPRLQPVFVPNVFTPNNDSKNDSFHPVAECIEEITFTIFDRWGKVLFISEAIDNGWDGTFEGELQNNDTYTWKLIYEFDGQIKEETGFVLLLN